MWKCFSYKNEIVVSVSLDIKFLYGVEGKGYETL